MQAIIGEASFRKIQDTEIIIEFAGQCLNKASLSTPRRTM
jgi:hypothetical protein